jgi:probable rRNA maturation factor
MVDLDLAFEADPDLAPELRAGAGAWADPLAGAEPWHQLLATWLSELGAELPENLRSSSYSLGLSLVDDSEIAALNADWRGKPGPTDVLAFAAQDEADGDAPPMPWPPGLSSSPADIDAALTEEQDEDAEQVEVEDGDDDDGNDDDDGAEHADGEGHDDEGLEAEAFVGSMPLELGDIVISLDTAARQAADHGHSLEHELLFLASHGLLHLLGWDHPDEASLDAMLNRQSQLLQSLALRA